MYINYAVTNKHSMFIDLMVSISNIYLNYMLHCISHVFAWLNFKSFLLILQENALQCTTLKFCNNSQYIYPLFLFNLFVNKVCD